MNDREDSEKEEREESSTCEGVPAVMWRPRNYYDPPEGFSYAVVLLNMGITLSTVVSVRQWWCKARLRICVDGATNQFHHLMMQQQQGQEKTEEESTTTSKAPPTTKAPPTPAPTSKASPCSLPDVISGDLDSVDPFLLELYAGLGVLVVPTPDQDETDFTKALRVLSGLLEERKMAVDHVLVVAGPGDTRFDHIMAILATLYKAQDLVSAPVVVVSGGSLLWLLRTGRHHITIPEELCHSPSAAWCGLVPVGQPVIASTTGLKWNLDEQRLAFGELVSTSNTYNLPAGGGDVTVTTSAPLLWTMGWRDEATHEPETNTAVLPITTAQCPSQLHAVRGKSTAKRGVSCSSPQSDRQST